MTGNEIAISDPYISKLLQVYRNFLPRRTIPLRTADRGPDGFIFILEGSCRYTFADGMQFTARKHDILYLGSTARYKMEVDADRYEFFVVNFLFATPCEHAGALFHPRDEEGTKRLFSRLCTRQDVESPLAVSESLSLLYRILSAIIESTDPHYINRKSKAAMENAAETIRASCHNSTLSIASLAETAGMSEVYFRRLFARRFGVSPARYIMRARIDRARELMADSTFSLSDIAEQCGFSSLTYFYRVFRDVTGTTPAAYRGRIPELPL